MNTSISKPKNYTPKAAYLFSHVRYLFMYICISLNVKMTLLDIKLNAVKLIQNANDMTNYNKSFP